MSAEWRDSNPIRPGTMTTFGIVIFEIANAPKL